MAKGVVYDEVMSEARLVTAEELLAMGEGRRELIAGRVVEMSPAGHEHSCVAMRIGRHIGNFVESARLGNVSTADGGFRLARDPDFVRVPDIGFVVAARLPGLDTRGYPHLAPDLAVEVVAPDDRFSEVEAKARMWLAHGTRLVWVADPEQRLVFVYRPDGSRVVHGEADTLDGGDVLPGFALPVVRCF
jgi:Uma2 family endonuclease